MSSSSSIGTIQAGRRVATSEERDELLAKKIQLEMDSGELFTLENRRKGIQIIYLELIRSYQTAYDKGKLPYSQDLREQFNNLKIHIRQNEKVFQNRFVYPRTATEPLLRRFPLPARN